MEDFEKLASITRFERSQYGDRVIDSDTLSSRFKTLQKVILESLDLFDNVDTTGAKEALTKHIKQAKLRIVKSYLKVTFLEQYGEELDSGDAKGLLSQVLNIVGDVDDEAEKLVWKTKLSDMSRRNEQSEKFAVYYTRIKSVVDKSDCDEKTKKWLTDNKFLESLSPTESDFICIHGDSSSGTDVKAALLDKKKQHVYKVAVRAVMEDDRLSRLEQAQAEVLAKVDSIADRICNSNQTPPSDTQVKESKGDIMEQLLQQNAQLISVMQVQQRGGGSYRGNSRGNRGRGGNYRGGNYRGGRGGGRPYRSGPQCFHCGIHGHEEKDCRTKSNPVYICIACGVAGHSQHSPKFHASKN